MMQFSRWSGWMPKATRPLVFWLGFVFFVGWLTAPDFLRDKERSEAGSFSVADHRGPTDALMRTGTGGGVELADPRLVSPVVLRSVDAEEENAGTDEVIAPVVLTTIDPLDDVELESAPTRTSESPSSDGTDRSKEAASRRDGGDLRSTESARYWDEDRPSQFVPGLMAAGFPSGGAAGTAPTEGAPAADSPGPQQGAGSDTPPGPVTSNEPAPSGGDGGGFQPAGDDPDDGGDDTFDPSVGGGALDPILEALNDVIQNVAGDPLGHGTILVNFSSSASEAEQEEILRILDPSESASFIPLTETFVVRLPELVDASVVLGLLRGLPSVDVATPSQTFEATGGHQPQNEPMFSQQWALRNLGLDGGFPDADIDGPEGWALVDGRRRVSVGVVDTGFDLGHEDMPRPVRTYEAGFPPTRMEEHAEHGTAVAGILAAPANDVGIVGVNHSWIDLHLASAGNGDGLSEAAVVDAISHLVLWERVQVINLSFAKPASTWTGLSANLVPICNAIATARDVLFVASAGNRGSTEPQYPAACPGDNVISVAASDAWDLKWSGSNYGVTVDVAAPGTGVVTLRAHGGYGTLTGTSAAASIVSGIASLVLVNDPGLKPAQVRDRVTGLTRTDQPAGLAIYGLPRANLCKALGGLCVYPAVP